MPHRGHEVPADWIRERDAFINAELGLKSSGIHPAGRTPRKVSAIVLVDNLTGQRRPLAHPLRSAFDRFDILERNVKTQGAQTIDG